MAEIDAKARPLCPSAQPSWRGSAAIGVIGGTADHVHAFFHLSRTQHVAKMVETLKSHSSRWIKAQGIEKFAWQRGYGCFSVGQSQVQALIRYIENQADHHLKLTFQDEFRQFLRRYEICFDEQYVWD